VGTPAVAWHRFGFSYTLEVVREGGAAGVALDVDPDRDRASTWRAPGWSTRSRVSW
jgi:hypothetical protein